MADKIYLDQAATSFPKPPSVVEAMAEALTRHSASPGRSGHRYSLAASRLVFQAREAAADLLGVDDSSRIVFFLNVTQALNAALNGMLGPQDHVLTTGLEHNSVMRPLNWLARTRGVEIEAVPTDPQGFIDPDSFRQALRPNTRLAVVNHASNVIGTLAPLAEIKRALDGVPLLVDAAQSAGAVPLNPVSDLADLLAFTGHKGLLGPTGTGGLWVRPGLEVEPFTRGGTGSRSEFEDHPDFMPDALEAGTPNTHGLAGLAAGLDYLQETGVDNIRRHEIDLTRAFLQGLARLPGAVAYGPPQAEDRVAVISMNLEGWSPSDLSMALDREFSIMTRPGLHCAPRAHQTIGAFPTGTVRFSLGWFNTPAEIDLALTALDDLSRRSR